MTVRTPAQITDAAAEEIRALNHSLYDGVGEPADAYSTVGNLSRLASMLPQALTMIGKALRELEDADQLRSDRGTLADDLAGSYMELEQAAASAQTLYERLNAAQSELSHLGLQDCAN